MDSRFHRCKTTHLGLRELLHMHLGLRNAAQTSHSFVNCVFMSRKFVHTNLDDFDCRSEPKISSPVSRPCFRPTPKTWNCCEHTGMSNRDKFFRHSRIYYWPSSYSLSESKVMVIPDYLESTTAKQRPGRFLSTVQGNAVTIDILRSEWITPIKEEVDTVR